MARDKRVFKKVRGASVARTVFVFYSVVICFYFAGLTGPACAQENVSGINFELYGFVRLDAIHDNSRMQHGQHAFWVLSEDPRVGGPNDAQLTIHPRLTRFGVRFLPKEVGNGVEARGVLEVDFQNGGLESRELLRMRLAYFEITHSAFMFRAGQDWDIISPLYPNVHLGGLMWNAGNLGDRRPQVWASWTPHVGRGNLVTTLASGVTGAVDNQDFDADGLLDGSESGQPFLQGRFGTEQRLWTENPARAGVWGHYAQEEFTCEGQNGSCESWVAGFDASIPLAAHVWVNAEGWFGQDLSDLRGGIGQGVNPLDGNEVRSKGGWAQLGVQPLTAWKLYLGATIDAPDDADVPSSDDVQIAGLPLDATGRTLNWSAYGAINYRPWQPVKVALEYHYWVTQYRGLDKGVNNRIAMHFAYFF